MVGEDLHMTLFEELKKLRIEHFSLAEKYIKLNESFENEIKNQLKKISKHFSNKWVHTKLKTLYISHNDNDTNDSWNPYILYWFSINDQEVWFNHKIGWFTSSMYNPTIYTAKKINLPKEIDIIELETYLSKILWNKPYKKDIMEKTERIKTFEDLQLLLGEKIELLEEGKIWYTGWDIADIFFIIKDLDKKIRIYYSTNGHGFGCDVDIEPNEKYATEKLEKFFLFLNTNNLNEITDKWETEILQNWEISIQETQ